MVSADIVQVLGSAVLPMLYGLLGALAAIGLSIHAKTKDSTLMPRDRLQMRLQALLGVLIGGTIGLFLTPAAATSALGAAASNTTLSASGLSFLAGLGVDKVFRWLGSLIQAMFGGASAPPPPPSRPVMQAPSKLVPPSDGAVTGQG